MAILISIDRPVASCDPAHIHIGPTAVDLSMLPSHAMIPPSEANLLKSWKSQDLYSYYRQQRSNRYR